MHTEKTERYSGWKLASVVFECAMAVLYLALSVVLLFTPLFNHSIHGGLKIGVGVVLGLYGLFRIFRSYRKIIQRNE